MKAIPDYEILRRAIFLEKALELGHRKEPASSRELLRDTLALGTLYACRMVLVGAPGKDLQRRVASLAGQLCMRAPNPKRKR